MGKSMKCKNKTGQKRRNNERKYLFSAYGWLKWSKHKENTAIQKKRNNNKERQDSTD